MDRTTLLDVVLHPVRWQIIRELAEKPCTTRQLGSTIEGVSTAGLYRHVQALVDHDVIRIVGEEPIRGTVERTYGLVDPGLSGLDLSDADEQRRAVLFLLAAVERDVDRYLTAHAEQLPPPGEGVTFTLTPLYFAAGARTEFFGELRALIERYTNPTAGQRVDMTMIQVPRD